MTNEKIITQIKIGKKKIYLYFDEEKLEISHNTYVEFNLYVNKKLTNKEYNEIKRIEKNDKLKQYSFSLLSKSRLSEKGYIDKLISKGASSSQINSLVKEMKRLSLINDEQFVIDYLDIAKEKHIGINKIKEDLCKKKIDSSLIENIHLDNEIDIARKNLISLERKYAKLNYENRKRHIYDNLLRLGFDYHIASTLINEINDKDEEQEMICLKNDYQIALRKYKNKYKDRELKQKVINYLLNKGYCFKDIQKLKEIDEL